MGLNCGCPVGEHLPDLTIAECKESLGQIQKVIFQRIFASAGTKNEITASAIKTLTGMSSLLSADDGTKIVVSPYIQNPATEPGEARTFGGGNQTLGGIEIVIGREPTSFDGVIYQEAQSTIATLKQYSCENIGVYLIDENGNIGCYTSSSGTPTPTVKYHPIPIESLFVGDKNLGGLEEPDSNAISWKFKPNWSDGLVIVKSSDFNYNPLTDLVNAASV